MVDTHNCTSVASLSLSYYSNRTKTSPIIHIKFKVFTITLSLVKSEKLFEPM